MGSVPGSPPAHARLCGRVIAAFVVAVTCLLASAGPASADRAFTPRFKTADTGGITMAANTLYTCPASDVRCAAAQAGSSLNNNVFNMGPIQLDPAFALDSSSAILTLPAGATVLWAGLYWGADTSKGAGGASAAPDGSDNALKTIQLKAPGQLAPQTLGPAGAVLDRGAPATRYQGFRDVTSIVSAAGGGSYTMGGVQAGTGQDRYAGWTIVVAYRDTTAPARDLTVFDGFKSVASNAAPTSIPISGFTTPPTGPVRTTLGFVAYEGDRNTTGAVAELDNQPLTDAVTPANNFFQSSISRNGVTVTDKTPDYENQLGYDSKLIKADGILANSADSASIGLRTNGDAYFPGAVSFATDLYAPDLNATKTVANITNPGAPKASPGDVLEYTISVANGGLDGATATELQDTIPGDTTYVPGSLTIDGTPRTDDYPGTDTAGFDSDAGRAVFWLGTGAAPLQGGTLAPSASATATFRVQVDPSAPDGTTFENRGALTFTAQTLGTPLQGATNDVTTQVTAPDLTVTKAHTPQFVAGGSTTFTITVANEGSAPTDGSLVTLSDQLDPAAFVAPIAASGPGWSCGVVAGLVTCTRSSTVAAGASYPPITITSDIAAVPPATIINTATVSGGGDTNPSNNSGSDIGGSGTLADLRLTKSADVGVAPQGSTVTYTLQVENGGPSAAAPVTVTDTLNPADYGDVTASSSLGSCTTAVVCALGPLASGQTATVTITATILAHDTTLTNVATVGSTTPDPVSGNDTGTADVLVPPSADVSVVKVANNPTPETGVPGALVYDLVIQNHGPETATDVVVNDELPADFTPGALTVPPGATCNSPGPGGTLRCTFASLSVGAGAQTITVPGTLGAAAAAQAITNSATVTDSETDPVPENDSSSVTVFPTPSADLQLVTGQTGPVDAGGEVRPVLPGELTTLTIWATNAGPTNGTNVLVQDTLPAGLQFVSADPGPGASCTPGPALQCTFAAFPSGETRPITVLVRPDSTLAGQTVPVPADVAGDQPDPIPSNNFDSAAVRVLPIADLSLTKTASTATPAAGETVTFSLVVSNAGPQTANHVVLTDALPAGLTVVSTTPSQGSCTTDPVVSCALGALPAGAGAQVLVTALVQATAAGQMLVNTATVTGDEQDPDPSGNSASATIQVSAAPSGASADVRITKSVTGSARTGGTLTYRLTASNAGPDTAANVRVTDTLSSTVDVLGVVSRVLACQHPAQVVTCTTTSLPPGASTTVDITVRPRRAGTLSNTATILSVTPDPDTTNNSAAVSSTVTAGKARIGLKARVSDTHPAAGQRLRYTSTVSVAGTTAALDVVTCARIPAGLTITAVPRGATRSGSRVCWKTRTIPAGTRRTFTVTVRAGNVSTARTVRPVSTADAANDARRAVAGAAVRVSPAGTPSFTG